MLSKTHILAGALAFIVIAAAGIGLASADSNCSNSCRAAYGSCYKSSQDRSRCQSQLQRCLEACIRRKR